MKNVLTFALVVAAFIGSYCLGKYSVKVTTKTEVKYVDLPTVHVSITPRETGFEIPNIPQYIWYIEVDTVTLVETQKVDTAAILADWIVRREYGGTLVQDSTGTIDYHAFVQYNRLQNISLDYTPRYRVEHTTHLIREKYFPFINLGYLNADVTIGGGVFYGKWGASANYMIGKNAFGASIYRKL